MCSHSAPVSTSRAPSGSKLNAMRASPFTPHTGDASADTLQVQHASPAMTNHAINHPPDCHTAPPTPAGPADGTARRGPRIAPIPHHLQPHVVGKGLEDEPGTIQSKPPLSGRHVATQPIERRGRKRVTQSRPPTCVAEMRLDPSQIGDVVLDLAMQACLQRRRLAHGRDGSAPPPDRMPRHQSRLFGFSGLQHLLHACLTLGTADEHLDER